MIKVALSFHLLSVNCSGRFAIGKKERKKERKKGTTYTVLKLVFKMHMAVDVLEELLTRYVLINVKGIITLMAKRRQFVRHLKNGQKLAN